jgi:hypothetical protein
MSPLVNAFIGARSSQAVEKAVSSLLRFTEGEERSKPDEDMLLRTKRKATNVNRRTQMM